MASVHLHLLLLLLPFSLLFFLQLSLSLSSPLLLPLTKDPQTNQHLTRVFYASELSPTNLVLDLNSPFLWVGISSTTNSSVLRRSIHCSAAGLDHQPGSSGELCRFPIKNPVTGETAAGELVQSIVAVDNRVSESDINDELFVHGSGPSGLLTGLASSAKGVFGLGRNRVGVVEQVTHSSGLSKKFSLCLSSSSFSNGMISFGENNHPNEILNSMIYTPILMGNGDSYNINLKGIKVQNKKLPLHQLLTSIKISTIAPYSLMESNIYGEFVTAFADAAEGLNMVRADPVGRFELCYRNGGESEIVPMIDLVLQSEMVKWRINGHNSMVKVNKEVICLGISEGGEDLGASIVLGNHQLEDNLLEFDLGSSMLGFSSSLIAKATSCSTLSLSSMHKNVQSL